MEHYRIYHDEMPAFLLKCAETPVVGRLRGVGMNCGCEYTSFPRFRGLRPYSRFDHSMGVALIVWHFTGDRAQALAGLLHDVATPVFAHVVDFMRGDYLRQEATEAGTEAMIAFSAPLRSVLAEYGLTTGDVCDYHHYPIADNAAPRLSADRLEYTLGNCVNYGVCGAEDVKRFYGDLTVGAGEDGREELVFRDRAVAGEFALAALECAKIYVSDADRYAMQRLSEILRAALEFGVIGEADLHATEPAVIEKLRSDARTAALWDAFAALGRIVASDRPGAGDGWRRIAAKKRYIDPLVLGEGRLSRLCPAFSDRLDAFLNAGQEEWILGT